MQRIELSYDANHNTYSLLNLTYGVMIGTLQLWEGPGWLFISHTKFLDADTATLIGEYLTELNRNLNHNQ